MYIGRAVFTACSHCVQYVSQLSCSVSVGHLSGIVVVSWNPTHPTIMAALCGLSYVVCMYVYCKEWLQALIKMDNWESLVCVMFNSSWIHAGSGNSRTEEICASRWGAVHPTLCWGTCIYIHGYNMDVLLSGIWFMHATCSIFLVFKATCRYVDHLLYVWIIFQKALSNISMCLA